MAAPLAREKMIDIEDLPESVAPAEPAARVVSIPIGMSPEQVEHPPSSHTFLGQDIQ